MTFRLSTLIRSHTIPDLLKSPILPKCSISLQNSPSFKIPSVLQLAFKKYKLEHAGIWAVTDFEDETHPMRLYQGVIRKWDSRLHYELDDWKQRIDDEKKFCVEFFCEYAFDDEKIQAIIDYKDAFSLKEVVAHLLYDHDYVLTSFLSRQLDKKGRLKVAKINN